MPQKAPKTHILPPLILAVLLLSWGDLATLSVASDNQLILAADGETDYQIVIPDALPDEEIDASLREMARLIQVAFQANGAELPVVRESEKNPNRPGIHLGATRLASEAGITLDELSGYDYVHKVVGENVVIVGGDEPSSVATGEGRGLNPTDLPRLGTGKAVTDFVRQYGGVRFLFPDVGRYVTDSTNLDLLDSPALEFLPTPVIQLPANLDVTKKAHVAYNFWRSRNSLYHLANNQFPIFNQLWSAHSHQSAVPPDEYYESHPEYFAMLGGERRKGVQYCISNPGFQELNYQYLAGAFDQGYDTVYLGHSDGFRACQCEACHELYGTGDDWTEKLWIFNRHMAERLYESHPDKTVVLVAYTITERAAPKSFDAFPPNTMLMVTGTNEKDLAMWENVEIPLGITSYIYSWTPNYVSRYVPMNTPQSIARQMQRLYRHNVRGIYRDGGGPYLHGLEGPVGYVMGRIWDDPENLTAEELTREYLEAAYGNAAAPMQRFFDRLYQGFNVYADYLGTRLEGWRHIRDGFHILGFLLPQSLLENLDLELTRAEAVADNERVEARLALIRRELEWLRHTAEVVHLYQAYEFVPENLAVRDELLNAIDRRNDFVDGMYEGDGGTAHRNVKPHPAWRSTLFPPGGHNANHLRLAYNRYRENFADSAMNWDTDAMRAAPPPGAEIIQVGWAGDEVTLDSAEWDRVEPATLAPLPGTPEDTPATRVQTLYDANALYLLFEAELPEALLAQALKQDETGSLDRESIDVHLAPRPGEDVTFRFKVGPSDIRYEGATGLIADEMHLLYNREDPDWTGPWEAEVRGELSNDRWQALLTIPYSTFETETAQGGMTQWRANFGRVHTDTDGTLHRQIWSGSSGMEDMGSMGGLQFEAPGIRARLRTMRREQGLSNPPPQWAALPNPLPDELRGNWRLQLDPMEQGLREDWHTPDHDDNDWLKAEVPAWYGEIDLEDFQGYAWYRLPFTVPQDWEGKPLNILFAGVDEQAWVYVNGELIREHSVESEGNPPSQLYDQPFSGIASPPLINYGGENVLAVRVHNSMGQGGLWRPVFIHAE